MNRMEQIIRRSGTWVDTATLFDEPASDAPAPVLPSDLPSVCQGCGAEYHPGKGSNRVMCGRCQVRHATAAAQAKRNPGRFGVPRREG